jgi:hypothetical protein
MIKDEWHPFSLQWIGSIGYVDVKMGSCRIAAEAQGANYLA